MSIEISTKQIAFNVSLSDTQDILIKNKDKIPITYKSYLQVKYGKSYKYDLIKYGLCDESSSDEGY